MKQNFKLKILDNINKDEYQKFILITSKLVPNVLAYHYSFYIDILSSNNIGEQYIVGFYNDDILRAVLPGFIKKSDLGVVYSSMPFFGPNASIICDPDYDNYEIYELVFLFLIKNLSKIPNILSASFYTPFLSDKFEWYEKIIKPEYTIEKRTQYLDIQMTEWSSKIKYDLRKAEKQGLTVSTKVSQSSLDAIYEIYIQNCVDYAIPPKPRKIINELAKQSCEGDNVEFYFALHENKIIGGLIVVYSESTLSYYLPCSLDNYRTFQPITFLIDKAFENSKRRGLEYWNWEASPESSSGVYQFKKKWGSLESEYKIYIKLFQDSSVFSKLGEEKIRKSFPYFYVFPFNQI
jgi:hypothetical protein